MASILINDQINVYFNKESFFKMVEIESD